MKKMIKAIFRPLARFMRKVTYHLMKDVIKDLEDSIRSNNVPTNISTITYEPGTRIRIMFLFQAASFWPSWESFYDACMEDDRFQVKFCLLEELYGDTTQMLSAKEFLDMRGIPYELYSEQVFQRFHPHVFVMQTPYDYGHRSPKMRSAEFKRKGTRIVYIPYGIEIADTEHARDAHFNNPVVRNAWRVFTFSERMCEDYYIMCPNSSAVKCVGHPKFDGLYHRDRFPLQEEIQRRAAGRRILVWHVHFPKLVPQPDGSKRMATPDLEHYLKFAQYITSQEQVFTVLLPHPKFLDGEGKLGTQAKKICSLLTEAENVYLDWSDDYRNTLLNGDFLITDRSALMVEAGCTTMPILYMYNDQYIEPMTPAIQPLMDSYYQGTTEEHMKAFVEQCLRGEDPMREARIHAFQEMIPFFDGKCGERIKEHIADAITGENQNEVLEQLKRLESEVSDLREQVDRLANRRTDS